MINLHATANDVDALFLCFPKPTKNTNDKFIVFVLHSFSHLLKFSQGYWPSTANVIASFLWLTDKRGHMVYNILPLSSGGFDPEAHPELKKLTDSSEILIQKFY